MKSKTFLLFSCLVFSVSVIYFAFVTIKGKTRTKSQQPPEVFRKLNEDNYQAKIITSDLQYEELNGLTDAELEAAIEFLDTLNDELNSTGFERELQEGQSETLNPAIFDTQGSEKGSDSDLEKMETMFRFYKRNLDRHWDIAYKTTPIMKRLVELDENTDELDNLIIEKSNRGEDVSELREEYRQLQKERVEISEALEPLDKLQAQVDKEWADYLWTNHGMSNSQFLETYREALRSWLANQ